MKRILNLLFNATWDYLVPQVIKWIARWVKIQQIESEVDKKTEEIENIRKEIDSYFEANPDATEIPKTLEDKLRLASRNGVDGL